MQALPGGLLAFLFSRFGGYGTLALVVAVVVVLCAVVLLIKKTRKR